MKQLSKDQKDLDEGLKIFNWIKYVSRTLGLWPLAQNNFVFFTTFSYFTVVMILEWMDVYYSLNDFDRVLDNLLENLSYSHIYVRGIILRLKINKIRQVIEDTIDNFSVDKFKNSSEIKIFLSYINEGKFFVKSFISFMAMTVIIWYISPLTAPAPIADDNETIIYILPYRFHVVFEINDYKSYMLTYISYAPYTFIHGCSHASVECILITLIYYLRGRLVILVGRINALTNKPKVEKYEINEIIVEHIELLKFGETVISTYSTSLMFYMMSATMALCVICYKILINFMIGPNKDLVQYLIYVLATYLIIGVLSTVSEGLISECNKVSEAFWNCEWYNMPLGSINDIMFCISRSQKPLALKIGKFSTFGNNTMTIVQKTAMGYLSVLRNFMVIE
ncbi:uncharacterized protein LOC130673619 isoform X2 [Microplitis mediator]|uniref:uncharacterized protein LOC130673619 isoform X2 n=1 Tax=Microplitis mediator TaxID=375433 RepID=UPI002552638D|nr:uncharacterized protein LOC130673619 isoform X2 [Microplitis mediator]